MENTSRVMDAEAVQLHRALVQRNAEDENPAQLVRPHSFHGDPTPSLLPHSDMASLKEPGGFRRNYLQTKADDAGVPEWQRPKVWQSQLVDYALTLSLFDEFGGREHPSVDGQPRHVTSGTKVFIALLKANVGPGALFLPRAFQNGGYLVAIVVIASLGFLTTVTTLRLLKVRNQFGGKLTYGEVLQTAIGHRVGRIAVDISITLLQCGVCATYFIFITNMLQNALMPTRNHHLGTFIILVMLQLVIIIPLTWVRQVARLAATNILADVLILGSLIAVVTYELQDLFAGPKGTLDIKHMVAANSPDQIFVFLGTACFVFEGIGLVIPTADSMREKDKFPRVFSLAMMVITMIFLLCGLAGYFAFHGLNQPSPIILHDLPKSAGWNVVRLAYATAVLFTFPFQFLPAIRLMEQPIFGTPVTNPPYGRKVLKSFYRTAIVISLAMIAISMREKLEHFVSLVGALCGVPLAFIYPVVAHYTMADSLWSKVTDTLLFFFGIGIMLFCSVINIYKIFIA